MMFMQKVQACTWNPFKLNEIVNLEKCLQEAVADDTRLGVLITKLANDCSFLEPTRKLRHLSRGEEDIKSDSKLKRRNVAIRQEIEQLNKEIEYYRSRHEELKLNESETKSQLCQLRKKCLKTEADCEKSMKEFELILEQVTKSFERTLPVIQNDIPNFVESIPESNLNKQLKSISTQYRRCLVDLAKNAEIQPTQQPQLATQLSYLMNKSTVKQLESYLKSIDQLHRDISLIEQAQSEEIHEEFEILKAFEEQIEYLEKPLVGETEKITVKHDDVVPNKQPEIVEVMPEVSVEDVEYSRLICRLDELLK